VFDYLEKGVFFTDEGDDLLAGLWCPSPDPRFLASLGRPSLAELEHYSVVDLLNRLDGFSRKYYDLLGGGVFVTSYNGMSKESYRALGSVLRVSSQSVI
jgi:hypothetical protein